MSERPRARLLGGVSLCALASVSAAITLGVSLATPAQASPTSVTKVQGTTYNLQSQYNPITFLSGTNIDTSGSFGDAVQGSATTSWTVTNQGTLTGYADGVGLFSQSNLTNSGSITGGAGYAGVHLFQGGNVTNQTGGVITASGSGVYLSNVAGSVSNAGSISGGTFGVGLSAGGTLSNTGNISGGAAGVQAFGSATITNGGMITVAGGFGSSVQLAAGGTLTNQTGGNISGGTYGVYGGGAPANITNAGLISGTSDGVKLTAGGNVINQSGGTLYGGTAGVLLSAGGYVNNQLGGNISGQYGVKLTNGGTVNNQGLIQGSTNYGIVADNAPAFVSNTGTITSASAGYGVALHAGGNITNLAGGNITGVYIAGAPGNVTNAGVIEALGGTTVGVEFGAGGLVANSGNISGGRYGVYIKGAGNVTNAAGGSIAATGAFGKQQPDGVRITGLGTVNNAGNITALNGTGGVALMGGGDVTNSGTIDGLAFGVGDTTGNVTNLAGGVILGSEGVFLDTGSVTNAGVIGNASSFIGVQMALGGALTNQTGGSISGAGFGFETIAGNATVSNAAGATIAATGAGTTFAVYINGVGNVTNAGGISASGNTSFGIRMHGGVVANSGAISGGAYGVYSRGNLTLTNAAGGTIGVTGNSTFPHRYVAVDVIGAGDVTNGGNITAGPGMFAYGVRMSSGTLTNSGNISATQVADTAVYIRGAGSVTNSGTITAGAGPGVELLSGNVTNLGGGVIVALGYSVTVGSGTVTNAGMIGNATSGGVAIAFSGGVDNQPGGMISGGEGVVGVTLSGNLTVINAAGASITGTGSGLLYGSGVYDRGLGNITNAGAISGVGNLSLGIDLRRGGVVTNTGVISGGAYGVYSRGNLTLTNAAGGAINATAATNFKNPGAGIKVVNGVGDVTNNGSIASTGFLGSGVLLKGGGTVTNTGVIAGGSLGFGVYATGATSQVVNSGNISGGGEGVLFNGSGNVTNMAGGSINGSVGVFIPGGAGAVANAGSISGYVAAVQIYDFGATGPAIVTNSGNITSTATPPNGLFGVEIRGPGAVTNSGLIQGFQLGVYLTTDFVDSLSGGNVTNLSGGTISGNLAGVEIFGPGNVINAGLITAHGNATVSTGVVIAGSASLTNQLAGTISGDKYGVSITGNSSVTNAGTISGGAASVVFHGNTTNVLTLTTGSTLIGPAVGSTASAATNALVLQGQGVANNNFLNFNTLAVNATGVWALNGVSTIGATAINSGDLEVGDAAHPGAVLTSPVTVNAGGELSGHGMVAGSVVDNGGTVSPGGTIGTLTISGNLTLSGSSTTDIEIAPPNLSSLLVVGGTASLGGGLDFLADPGVYRKGEQFHFLTAGSITGTFGTVTISNGLPGSLTQTGTTDTLTLLAGNFAATGGSPNETAIGAAVNDIPVGAGDFDPVFNALVAIGPGNAQNHALDELGGEIYADTLTVGRQSTRGFLATLGDRLEGADSGAAAGPSGNATGDPAVWGQVLGRFDSVGGDTNAHGFTANAGGLAFGVSGVWGPTTAGAALSWDETNLSLHGLGQSGRVDETQIAAYGEERFGGMVYVNGAASVGFTNGHGERAIVFTGVDRHASGDFNGTTTGLAANLGARLPMSQGWMAEPSVGIVYSTVHQGDVSEAGAGSADLAVAGRTQGTTASVLALRFSNAMPTGEGLLSADIKLAWAHDFDRVTPTVSEAFPVTPGAGFMLTGANTGQDAGILSGGLSLAASRSLSVFARYDASVARDDTEQMVDLGLKFRW